MDDGERIDEAVWLWLDGAEVPLDDPPEVEASRPPAPAASMRLRDELASYLPARS